MYLAIQTEHPSKLENGAITFAVGWDAKTDGKWPAGNYIIRVRAALTGQGTPTGALSNLASTARQTGTQRSRSHRYHGQAANYRNSVLLRRRRCRAGRPHSIYSRERNTRSLPCDSSFAKEGAKQLDIGLGRPYALWIDWLEIERLPDADRVQPPGLAMLGELPLDDQTKKPVVPELETVRASFERFAREAFRGKEPGAKFIDGLVRKYETRLSSGDHPVARSRTAWRLCCPRRCFSISPNLIWKQSRVP